MILETTFFFAEFVEGPLKGESVTSQVAAMTEEKWSAIVPAREVAFSQASFEQRKDGLELYVKAHCAALLRRYEQSLVDGGSAVAEERCECTMRSMSRVIATAAHVGREGIRIRLVVVANMLSCKINIDIAHMNNYIHEPIWSLLNEDVSIVSRLD